MSTITFRMPFGVPGDVSRPSQATIEAQAFGATAFPSYGIAAVMTSGKVVPVSSTGQTLYGVLVRPFPITGANASDPLGTSVPPTVGVANILKRGYFSVFVQLGYASAAAGVGVWVRYQGASGSQVLGGFEAATSGNNYSLTPALMLGGAAYFTGPVDANQIAEMAYNL
jgi:hypothetical protein